MLNCKNCYGYLKADCPFYQGRMENKPLKEIEKAAHKDKSAAIYLAACLLYGHRMPQNIRKARALLEKHISKYDAPAKYVMSLCYFLNPIKPIVKPEQAIELCEQAAEGHCSQAAMQLYRCYVNGHTVKQDYTQAGKWCKLAAEHGNIDAYSTYAEMCCTDKWGVYNLKEACKYFEKLMLQGNTDLKDRLRDLCYEYAEQVSTRNLPEACEYFEKAQEYGHTNAYNRLVELHKKDVVGCYKASPYERVTIKTREEAYYLQRGKYCLENKYAPNARTALSCYKSGREILLKKRTENEANLQCSSAEIRRLARMMKEYDNYFDYMGNCQQHIRKCYSIILTEEASPSRKALFEKAVGGDAEAQYELARLFQDEKFDIYDLFESAHWHRLAAEQGHASAQHRLGWCYIEGCGVEKNETEAFQWTRKAAEQGNVNAEFNLGWCYYNGFGVAKSYRDAFCWYKAAAEQGNTKAQYQIGCFYENGTGVERNIFEAVKWFQKAANSGHALAQARLGVYYAKGTGVEQSYQKAVKYYGFAANKGIAIAQYNLGKCYFNGEGVDQSYEKAVEWYTHSAKQDCAVAQNNLAVCYFYGYGVRKDVNKALEWFEKSAKNGNKKAEANRLICEQQIEDNRTSIKCATETSYPRPTYGVDPPRQLESTIWHDFRTGERLSRNENGEVVNSQGETVSSVWWE